MVRTTILLFLFVLLQLPVSAVSLLAVDSKQNKGEEGRISNYSLTYIQTDGTYFSAPLKYLEKGWEVDNMSIKTDFLTAIENKTGIALFKYSLAYNSFVSFTTDLAVGSSFTASVRKNNNPSMAHDASFEFSRCENQVSISLYYDGKSVSSVNVPMNSNQPAFDVCIDVKGPKLRLWMASDTTSNPVLTDNNCNKIEGYFQVKNGDFKAKNRGATKFKDFTFRVDYAYGLQFILNKVEGSYIYDVYKNDNRLLYNEYISSEQLSPNMEKLIDSLGIVIPSYKYNTKPPIISNSRNDAGYWYCDNQPTSMDQPIPYGSVFYVTWQERVDSCGPLLENHVSVKLFNHADDEIYADHSCPCSERTCFLDSVFITAPATSFCEDEALTLTANIRGSRKLNVDDYLFTWTASEVLVPDATSDVLPVVVPGNFKVEAYKADDPTCKAISPYYTVRVDEKPVLFLKDTFGCVGTGLNVYATSTEIYAPYYKYKWSTGETSQYITVMGSGTYSVRVTNGTCVDSAVAIIDVDTCLLPSLDSLYIPKVVSPNGDGINDAFALPLLSEAYPNARCAIYDRNGRVLYEEDAAEFSWNGTYNGNKLPATDYWYEIFVYELYRYYRGHFTLLWGDGG